MTQVHGKFYTEDEFDIKKILKKKGEILELGRSCVHKDYRDKPIIRLLWKAISAYMQHYKIKILFGCASLPGTNYKKYKKQLSFIYHNYLALFLDKKVILFFHFEAPFAEPYYQSQN